jgi:hypothetical protein
MRTGTGASETQDVSSFDSLTSVVTFFFQRAGNTCYKRQLAFHSMYHRFVDSLHPGHIQSMLVLAAAAAAAAAAADARSDVVCPVDMRHRTRLEFEQDHSN